jgi:Tfp pilus assembly protein PilN
MKAVNLLPSDQRGSAKTTASVAAPKASGSAFGAYAVLGALAVAVVAVAGYVLTDNTIKDRRVQLANVTRQDEVVQAKARSLQAFADFKNLADQRIATVRGLAASRFDWDRTLQDLSRAIPGDVHLKSLSGTTGTQISGGGSSSGSALRGAIQAPALELSGCTTNQQSVANLMSNLRNVRGVTRVTLSTSSKDDSGSAAVTAVPQTSPNGTEEVPASLCPKGAPPAFDVLVFFEHSTVAPTASVNPGAAPAAGAPAAAGATTTTSTTSTTAAPATGTTSSASGVTSSGVQAATQGGTTK